MYRFSFSILLLLLSSCASLEFLAQATHGQLSMINRARPIGDAIKDETTPSHTRELLQKVKDIKSFSEQYGLKPTKNYETYVDLKRPAVVWLVSACKPYEFTPKKWSYPIVGSFPYQGWFNREKAMQVAEELKKQDWDVDVRGASAYSTLGWFKDPILSTMMSEGESSLGDFAEVILHESLHATVFVDDQTQFNESLASFVGEELAREYLKKNQMVGALTAYQNDLKKQEESLQKLHNAYTELDTLYQKKLSREQTLDMKSKVLERLQSELKFKRPINNATLIQYKVYNRGKQAFESYFRTKCKTDWRKFLSSLNRLRPEVFTQAQQEDIVNVVGRLNCD